MKLFPWGWCKEKHFPNTWKVFFGPPMCGCSLQLHTRLCVGPEAKHARVSAILCMCEHFMTLSASLSGCIQFICVLAYFFLNGTFPCVYGCIFRVRVFCFFDRRHCNVSRERFQIRAIFECVREMYFSVLYRRYENRGWQRKCEGNKKKFAVDFQVDTFFFNPFIDVFRVCAASGWGGGGWPKGWVGGEHIKMITHRKTAAFMVFLYFLMFYFLFETAENVLAGNILMLAWFVRG